MKPILYSPTAESFNNNGIGVLYDTISCNVTESRNELYELEMTYPITGAFFNEIHHSSIIKAKPFDGGEPQLFSVYKITKPINGRVTIFAEHISYRLSYIPCDPFTASDVDAALQGFSLHAFEDCPFTFWTDKTTVANYKQDFPASIRSRLAGSDGSILDVYGGEYEFDNFTVKLHNHRGADNGVVIRYGVNLTDLEQEESIEETITGIYPFWGSREDEEYGVLVTLDEGAIYSENADNFPYHRTVVMDFTNDFEEEPSQEDLRARTNKYITDNKIGIPKVNLTVSFIPLWQTEEYKNIAPLERVKLCDTVTVKFDKLGINAKAKVLQTKYDVLNERYTEIKIGEIKETSLSDTITSMVTTETDAVRTEVNSSLHNSITRATELITGAYGGYKVEHMDADGHIYETLYMDTDNMATAHNVIRINKNGIGFSVDGINGPYTNAWTIDGHLNASFIDSGILDAQKAQIINLYAGAVQYDDEKSLTDALDELSDSIPTAINDAINDPEGKVSVLSNEVSALNDLAENQLNPMLQRMSFTPGGGLEITAINDQDPTAPTSGVQVVNTGINFLYNNDAVAWINHEGFNFHRGILTNSLKIGNFMWIYDYNETQQASHLRLLVTS